MAPWSAEKSHKEDEQDLHSVLDARQRGDLTLFIANATEVMRKTVTDAFDPKAIAALPKKKEPAPASEIGSKETSKSKIEDESKSKEADALTSLQQQKAAKEREEALDEPELKKLKEAAVAYFDEWRDSVIARVGEIVNSQDKAEQQKEKAASASTTANTVDSTQQEKAKAKVDDVAADEDVDTALQALYPPIKTSLADLDKNARTVILHSMLLLLLSLKHYSAHSRILLLHFTSSLHLPVKLLSSDETKLSQGLLEAAKHLSADAETKARSEENKSSRYWKVGLASAAGALVVGLTGGLAAPLVAAGLGTVLGGLGLGATAAATYLGVLAESGIIVGSLFGAYGASMTGKMMDAYAKEVEDFAFLPLRPSTHHHIGSRPKTDSEDRRLRVAIGITGWLTDVSEIINPWRIIDGSQAEAFALRWEPSALLELGNAMTSLFKSAAWSYAKGEILRRTVLGALGAAMWPISILKIGKVIDNPFSIAKTRADKAGRVLADALINRAQGERPVTLLGFSLGARVVYACLRSLAERKEFGLIEAAILIGTPAPSEASEWRALRSVVSGRLVNVYSENDSVLGFMYRTSSIQLGVAGLEAIGDVAGVENVDVSDMISGHLRYRYLSGSILKKIAYEDLDLKEVERQEATLKLVELHEGLEAEAKDGDGSAVDTEEEKKRLEAEVKKKNEQTVMQKAAHRLHIS